MLLCPTVTPAVPDCWDDGVTTYTAIFSVIEQADFKFMKSVSVLPISIHIRPNTFQRTNSYSISERLTSKKLLPDKAPADPASFTPPPTSAMLILEVVEPLRVGNTATSVVVSSHISIVLYSKTMP